MHLGPHKQRGPPSSQVHMSFTAQEILGHVKNMRLQYLGPWVTREWLIEKLDGAPPMGLMNSYTARRRPYMSPKTVAFLQKCHFHHKKAIRGLKRAASVHSIDLRNIQRALDHLNIALKEFCKIRHRTDFYHCLPDFEFLMSTIVSFGSLYDITKEWAGNFRDTITGRRFTTNGMPAPQIKGNFSEGDDDLRSVVTSCRKAVVEMEAKGLQKVRPRPRFVPPTAQYPSPAVMGPPLANLTQPSNQPLSLQMVIPTHWKNRDFKNYAAPSPLEMDQVQRFGPEAIHMEKPQHQSGPERHNGNTIGSESSLIRGHFGRGNKRPQEFDEEEEERLRPNVRRRKIRTSVSRKAQRIPNIYVTSPEAIVMPMTSPEAIVTPPPPPHGSTTPPEHASHSPELRTEALTQQVADLTLLDGFSKADLVVDLTPVGGFQSIDIEQISNQFIWPQQATSAPTNVVQGEPEYEAGWTRIY
ncbi:hypothetical protein DFH27DRAFT_65369 [Peziza echinospora]|nr:hypothetical protein DFH27DRAFT_65369 [Peziza echinospora]